MSEMFLDNINFMIDTDESLTEIQKSDFLSLLQEVMEDEELDEETKFLFIEKGIAVGLIQRLYVCLMAIGGDDDSHRRLFVHGLKCTIRAIETLNEDEMSAYIFLLERYRQMREFTLEEGVESLLPSYPSTANYRLMDVIKNLYKYRLLGHNEEESKLTFAFLYG